MSTAAINSAVEMGKNTVLPELTSGMQLVPVPPESIFRSVAPHIQSIEEVIRKNIVSDAPQLEEISRYLLSLGGKRIRPILGILCAQLFGLVEPTPEILRAGAGIELIHMATLLHDDIIDESPKRRNQMSAFRKFGLAPTLLAGDFLLTRAFGLCADLGTFVVTETEKTCIALSEGELLEGRLSTDRRLSVPEYIDIIGKKTAVLFALACAVGSHLAGGKAPNVSKLKEFGHLTGVAFQMADDILDVNGDEAVLGKAVGTDLRQQTPSLVNVLWLASGDSAAERFFSTVKPGPELCADALRRIKEGDIVPQALLLARDYTEQARDALQAAAPGLDPDALARIASLVDYTLIRCF